MNMVSEDLLNRILDAPVGQVVAVLGEILNCNINLEVIEQNAITPHQFVRKIVIIANELPVINAYVEFDSTVLPESIVSELLKKKRGVGTILNIHNIKATRNVIFFNRNTDERLVLRKYEIINDGIVWFTILEEIRLDNLGSNNNS
ncbi:MAG: hypothetical protein EPO37_02065 [Nitrosarchaeum sp.]|nr:MAG: hypothetical protein EPO37_02065 [Nitrosarchaeum sp.]